MKPAPRRRVASLALGLILSTGPAVASSEADKTTETAPRATSAAHQDTPHETAGDAYVPMTRELRRTAPPARPLRNGFLSVQVNVDENGNNILGDAANEPSIAVDPTEHALAAIGWRQFDTIESNFRQAGWGYTQDDGASWTFPGLIDPGVFRSDPVLDFDADGNFYYNSLTLTDEGDFVCTVYISENGGQTWDGGVFAWGGDKQWMAIDRTNGIGRGNIYANWTVFFSSCQGQFTRSYDEGGSYLDCIDVPGEPQWGNLTVGPDGALYVVGRGLIVAKSSTLQDSELAPAFDFVTNVNLGGNLDRSAGPNPAGLLGQAWVGVDHSNGPHAGNVYVLASVEPFGGGDPLDVHFVRSTDGGVTWSDPVRVNDDAPGTDAWQWFGTMSVAPNGRIDVIFNDTRNDPGGFDSEVRYTYSEDAGFTWSPSVALTPPFDPHVGWPNQNKIGDYYDMISDDDGASLAFAATFNGEQDVYYLRVGDAFCPADIDDDEVVGMSDVLGVLVAWGSCENCPEDIDGDGMVGDAELLAILVAWGPCTTGGCCLPDDSCDDATVEGDCVALGGFYRGNGSTCELDCPRGACCFDESCIVTSRAVCGAMGGTYFGDGTTCATSCNLARDDCSDAIVFGEGEYFYSSIGATTDGPDLPPECDEGGGLGFMKDVWFRYQASCDGTATASVCDSNMNTRMAVYEDGDCPGPFIACNDDACGVVNTRSRVLFAVETGEIYLIRIGSRTGSIGSGTLDISCSP